MAQINTDLKDSTDLYSYFKQDFSLRHPRDDAKHHSTAGIQGSEQQSCSHMDPGCLSKAMPCLRDDVEVPYERIMSKKSVVQIHLRIRLQLTKPAWRHALHVFKHAVE